MRAFTQSLLTASLLALLALGASAQVTIEWFTVDGGGGTSRGGLYSISGTIGQPDAQGTHTGGLFELAGGFWPGVEIEQTLDGPLLMVTRVPATGAVRVFWSDPGGTVILQESQAPNLLQVGSWADLAGPYQFDGTFHFFEIPNPSGEQFFRLRGP